MTAFVPNSVVLYVSDVEASTTSYRETPGHGPIKTYSGLSIFKLSDEMGLGLQAADEVGPAAEPHVGGTKLNLSNTERTGIDRLHTQWKALDTPVILEPTVLGLGYTFMATDPDGHRLHMCAANTSSFV